jgi:hypothetical protein
LSAPYTRAGWRSTRDPEALAMFVDERHRHFKRRSSSAWAKNALVDKAER